MTFCCTFCNNEFSTKSNMAQHQKRAKYCLKLQETTIQADKLICSCGITFATASNLNRHRQSCIECCPEQCRRKVLVCECGREFSRRDSLTRHKANSCTLKKPTPSPQPSEAVQLEMLKVMAELAQNQGTTNNTTNKTVQTINLQPLTQNYMQTEGNRLLTEQIVMEGRQPEIAGKILSSRVRVADKSRKKIEYQDEEGNLSNDSRKLTQGFFKAIQGKNKELTDEAYREIHRMVDEYIAADNAGTQEFTRLLTAGTDLQNMLMAINNVVDGVENDQSEDLINKTIKKIVN